MADEDSGLSPEAKLLALSDDQMSELIAKYLSRLNLTPEKIRDPSATAYKKALLKKIELDPDGTIPDPVLKGYDGREDEGDGDDELGTAVDELTNPTIGGRAEDADTLSPLKIPSADALSPSTASGGNLFTQMNLGTPPSSFTGACDNCAADAACYTAASPPSGFSPVITTFLRCAQTGRWAVTTPCSTPVKPPAYWVQLAGRCTEGSGQIACRGCSPVAARMRWSAASSLPLQSFLCYLVGT